jgi:FKBP-type peptidyl-prolyl cis-trans isomerase (trigger factor)
VSYTAEELLATWRGSDRLLLFIQLADPQDVWDVGLRIDGRPVEVKKAYSDVFPLGRERTFTGFYADVSGLNDNAPHQLEVTLPDGLKPGQFQGLFLENVETAYTGELTR